MKFFGFDLGRLVGLAARLLRKGDGKPRVNESAGPPLPRRGEKPTTKRPTFLLLLALLPLVASADEPKATTEVVAAGGVSLSDESGTIPAIRVTTNAPLTIGDAPICRLDVSLALMGLPGASVDLEEPQTWKSAEVFGELQRRIGRGDDGASTYVVGRAGFHTRILPRDQTPRDRFARSYGVGVRAERRDEDGSIRRSIAILYGRSDVAAPKFGKGQILIEGHAKLTTVKGVDLIVGGDAYLSVSRSPGIGARDVLRVWTGLAWGG